MPAKTVLTLMDWIIAVTIARNLQAPDPLRETITITGRKSSRYQHLSQPRKKS